jgi:hypothetical protein
LHLAESFHPQIQTIFLFDKASSFESVMQGPVLLYGTEAFVSEIQAVGFPYAVLVNPSDFSQMGVVAYTPRNIWMLFYFALSLLEPEDS